MSNFIQVKQRCYVAPIAITSTCINTISSWTEAQIPTLKEILHSDQRCRIVLHLYQQQYRDIFYDISLTWVSDSTMQTIEVVSLQGAIDIEAMTPFIHTLLQEKKEWIFNVYSVLYAGSIQSTYIASQVSESISE
tara:strand:+ start:1218 stop:1622 length:405 start_codon:yes stop_codon:yes gene_type:complete